MSGEKTPNVQDIEGSMLVPPIRGKCARCKRPILIRHAGQKYGPTCARKVAAFLIKGGSEEDIAEGVLA